MNKKKSIIIGSIVAIIIIIVDQFSKYLVSQNNYVQNTGIAFGIAQSNNIIILLINIIILSLMIFFTFRKTTKTNLVIPLFLVTSGGLSNLFDRMFRGYVIDFIDIKLFNFPVFNLADIVISLGFMMLVIILIKNNKNIDKFR